MGIVCPEAPLTCISRLWDYLCYNDDDDDDDEGNNDKQPNKFFNKLKYAHEGVLLL